MNYRSPVESMRHELEALEEQNAGLRAAPIPSPPPLTKKQAARRERETASLRKQLSKLERDIKARERQLGVRQLTAAELTGHARMQKASLACLALGVFVLSTHVALRARIHHVWTATTCTYRPNDEDTQIASYVVGGRTLSFTTVEDAAPVCFVPKPPLDGIGRISRPPTGAVPLTSKLSLGWMMTAGVLALFGAAGLLINLLDRNKRLRNEVGPDEHESGD